MNRANQYALYQQTNQGLLGIRQAEINYYVGLCVAFGTQAALIGGFTYGVFTQNQYNEDLEYASWFQDVYWVSSSGTIAASVHVILTSMLIQVFGPGLALHGPIGSMARACEGMRREQRSVITSFIIMIILFSISTILSFWAVMTTEAAAGATAVWLIATRYYYYYCERIYLRFYWKEESDYWRRSADFSDDPAGVRDDYEPPEVSKTREKLNALHQAHANRSSESSISDNGVQGPHLHWDQSAPIHRSSSRHSQDGRRNEKPRSKIFRILPTFKRGKSKNANKSAVDNPLNASLLANQVADSHGAQNPRALAMEGFLLIRRFSYSQSTENRKSYKWDRRYFILNFLGHMYYYKSRADFREHPRRPIHKRPILLHDFYAEVYNSEIDGDGGFSFRSSMEGSVNVPRTNSITSTLMAAHEASKPGKSTGQHIFEIKLIPRELEDHKTLTAENLAQHQGRTNNSNEDDMSDSDHDSLTNEERAAGNYAKQSYRRDWLLRCDTAEELSVWVDIIHEVCPSCFRSKT